VVLRLSHAAYLFDVIMLSKKTTNLLLFQTCHGTEVIGFHIMSNFSQTVQPHLCSFSIGTDNMLIIDVYVVSATANCERLVLHILSMLVDKRCVQFLILWETPSSDITDLTQLDDISFLEDTVTDKFLH
jgi:hypothetical protein